MSLHEDFLNYETQAGTPFLPVKKFLNMLEVYRTTSQQTPLPTAELLLLLNATSTVVSALGDVIVDRNTDTNGLITLFHCDNTIYVSDTGPNMEKFLHDICPEKYLLSARGGISRVIFREPADMAVAILALDKPWERHS